MCVCVYMCSVYVYAYAYAYAHAHAYAYVYVYCMCIHITKTPYAHMVEFHTMAINYKPKRQSRTILQARTSSKGQGSSYEKLPSLF